MNDRLLSFLGLCRRAGKLTLGNDMVLDAVDSGGAYLVVTASDISKNTERKILSRCEARGVRCLNLGRTKDEVSFALGRLCVVAAVCDKGFADKISDLINNQEVIVYDKI